MTKDIDLGPENSDTSLSTNNISNGLYVLYICACICIRLLLLFRVIVATNIGNRQREGLTFVMRPCDDLFYVGDLIYIYIVICSTRRRRRRNLWNTLAFDTARKYFHTLARSIEPQTSGN